MAKSIVTPADLRQFAGRLKENIEQFNQIEAKMSQQLNSYDWNDAVAARFKADFDTTREPIAKLNQKMEEFIPYLERKAETLESQYLNI